MQRMKHSFRIEPKLLEQCKRIAARHEITFSEWVRTILKQEAFNDARRMGRVGRQGN